jgi:diguanylate cyclase (GGDEF)-like protein
VAGLTALAFAAGWLSYAVTQAVGMAMGPLPVLLVLPTAWRRTRAGERAAALLLVGWSLYALGALSIVGLLAGWVALSFWSLHGFQFGATAEMLMWMAVLARRVQAVHDQARVLRGDRDRLHSLAHTDALTGLLNRRGLHEALVTRVALASPQTFVAIYVLDLDGFKAVNDRLGHDAGDALLVAVGQRLQRQLRTTDLVGRLGGDEFVLAASGFNDAADAARLGDQVLRAFDAPFELPAGTCAVGATIGYALAPQDGQDLDLLLKRADQALYAGKEDGRRQVRRAGGPNAATDPGDSV